MRQGRHAGAATRGRVHELQLHDLERPRQQALAAPAAHAAAATAHAGLVYAGGLSHEPHDAGDHVLQHVHQQYA